MNNCDRNIRSGLGGEYYFPLVDIDRPENSLTLHDLGEFIRRAGIDAGFIVQSEYQVRPNRNENVKKIDWVWLHRELRYPVVSFEIEGRDVPIKSIINDLVKFNSSQSMINVIVLYQIKNNHNLKKLPRGLTPKERVRDYVDNADIGVDVNVYLDADLFCDGGIEKLKDLAIKTIK